MTPGAVAAKKAALDAELAKGQGPIDVSFGYDFFSELCNRGDIKWGSFPNSAHGLKVPGALPHLTLPSYGPTGSVCAIPTPIIAPDDYLVGAGGMR